MQIQATCKKSQDSIRILERLEDIDELKPAQVRIVFNNRSAEDQMLLRQLSTLAGKNRRRISPEMLKTVGIASAFSLGTIAFGFSKLFGFI